jgi:hypothetical protein
MYITFNYLKTPLNNLKTNNMATIKNTLRGIVPAVLSLFILQGCNHCNNTGSQIPYNKEKAKVHFISLTDASALTTGYRKERTTLTREISDTNYLVNNFNLPNAESFNRDAIIALLNQKGAEGVRIYLGRDAKGLIRMVLAAVDSTGNDITTVSREVSANTGFIQGAYAGSTTKDAVLLESGQRCPTLCGAQSPLN